MGFVAARTLQLRELALRGGLMVAAIALALFLGGGYLAPTRAIGLVAGLVFVAIALRSLPVGLAIFTLFTFFESLPGFYNLVRAAVVVLVLAWLLRVASRERMPKLASEHPFMAAAVSFLFVWALVSVVWAESAGAAVAALERFAPAMLLVPVTYAAVRRGVDVKRILIAYVIGSVLTALIGLASGTGPDTPGASQEGRLYGVIGDPNFLAAVLVVGGVFAAFLLAVVRAPLGRLGLVVAIGVYLVALVLTQSRGGLVAAFVAAVMTLAFGGPVRRQATVAVLILGACGFVYFTVVSPPQALKRMTSFSAGGGSGRTDLWSIARQVGEDHPVIGVGAGNFRTVEPRYALGNVSLQQANLVVDTPLVVHNAYLEVWTELGVIGLAAFLALLAAPLVVGVRAVRRLARDGLRDEEILGRAVVIGFVALLAAYVFLSGEYEKPLWLLMGLQLALPTVARTSAGEQAPAEYDRDVGERLVEELEQRFSERLDAVLRESQRLERQRARLTQREQALEARERPSEPGPDAGSARLGEEVRAALQELTALATGLAERQLELERVVQTALARRVEADVQQAEETGPAVAERERRLAQLEAELARRSAEADEREAALAAASTPAAQPAGPTEADQARVAELEQRERELKARERVLEAKAAAAADEQGAREALATLTARLSAAEKMLRQAQLAVQTRDNEIAALERRLAEPSEASRGIEETLRARADELEQRLAAAEAHAADVAALEARLARAEEEARARRAELDERDRQLASLTTDLRAHEARRPQRPQPEAPSGGPPDVPVAEPAPAQERRLVAVAPAHGGRNIGELERRVAAAVDESPEQIEEWRVYLVYLRDYSDTDGNLQPSMYWLVDDVFGKLLDGPRDAA